MSKKSGPDLKIKAPPMKLCERCKSYGTETPMLHEMVCAGCGGFGRVDKETGAAIDQGVALVLSNREMRRLRQMLIEERRSRETEFDPYGELYERYGGLSRGD